VPGETVDAAHQLVGQQLAGEHQPHVEAVHLLQV
jgi:hypothetical protein